MDLLEQYYEETFGKGFYKDDKGIIKYSHVDNDCIYLEDMFLPKEHREQKNGWDLINGFWEVAKGNGYKEVITSVNTNIKTVDRSMKIILHYGFSFMSIEGNLIYFRKEIL